jgi:hypothetical protein
VSATCTVPQSGSVWWCEHCLPGMIFVATPAEPQSSTHGICCKSKTAAAALCIRCAAAAAAGTEVLSGQALPGH